MNYLTPESPEAFADFPPPKTVNACPKCKGHGGWNLTLNAYPLHSYENTPENRHIHSHFRQSCFNCSGNGETLDTCEHEFREVPKAGLFRCEHAYRCVKCGQERIVDSSD